MKWMMVDYLRRWGWGCFFGMVFVGMIDVMWTSYGTDAHSSFVFLCLFMLPIMVDWQRGHIGVMVILPASRKTLAHYYWGVVVFLPVLAVAAAFAVAGLLSVSFFSAPSIATLTTSFAAVVLASLIMTGASCWMITFFPPRSPEGTNNFGLSVMLFWFPTIWLALPFSNLIDITKQSPVVWLAAALLAILLCSWSFRRSERLLIARATPRRGEAKSSSRKPERIPPFKPGLARFSGAFFFSLVKFGFLFGLFGTGLMLMIRHRMIESPFFWACLFGFSVGSVGLLSGGVRFLRSLPLSVSWLALTLLLLPISSILGMIAAQGVLEFVFPGRVFGPHPASCLIPMAGAVCITSSLFVRYGGQNNRFIVMPLAMLASLVIFTTVPDVDCPAVVWWVLGFGLMAGAFFLNRHWLRSSESYRVATGSFARR